MGALQPVSPGQPLRFSAGDINACFEAARAHRERLLRQEDIATSLPQSGIVIVKNNTANDRDILEVLAIDVPLVLPTESLPEWRSRVALSCILPGTTHAGRYVVLQEPIPAGKIGRAMVIGVTPALLDVTAESDRFAEVVSTVATSLKTGTTGSARILWKESGTGAKRGVVMLTGETGGQMYIHTAAADPTTGDDSADGYVVGTIWVNTSADTAFVATDVAVGAAVWVAVGGGSGTFTGPLIPDGSSRIRLTATGVREIDTAGWYWFVLTAGGGGGGGGDSTSTPVSGWNAGGGGGCSGQRLFIGPIYLTVDQRISYTHGAAGAAGAADTVGGVGSNGTLELFDTDETTPIIDSVVAYGGGGGLAASVYNTSETKGIGGGYGGSPGPGASGSVRFPYPSAVAPGQDGRVAYVSGASPPTIYRGGRGGSLEQPTYADNDAGAGGDGGEPSAAGAAGNAGALDIISTVSFTLTTI
jgi:hypothetical protein